MITILRREVDDHISGAVVVLVLTVDCKESITPSVPIRESASLPSLPSFPAGPVGSISPGSPGSPLSPFSLGPCGPTEPWMPWAPCHHRCCPAPESPFDLNHLGHLFTVIAFVSLQPSAPGFWYSCPYYLYPLPTFLQFRLSPIRISASHPLVFPFLTQMSYESSPYTCMALGIWESCSPSRPGKARTQIQCLAAP